MDSNCFPQSVVTVDGIPNWEIQAVMKAFATDSAEALELGWSLATV